MGHRILEGEQTLLRIFLGESDQWHGRPLHLALLERFRKEGTAGVTVLRGIADAPHPRRDGRRGPGDDGEGPGGEVRTREALTPAGAAVDHV